MTGNLLQRLLAKRIWTPGRIDRLVGDTLTTLTQLGGVFEQRQVTVRAGSTTGVAWGQYLDDNHFSDEQWGFYGTSAGLQTLAMRARRIGRRPSADPDVARVLSLPRDRSAADPIFDDKRDRKDFDSVIKLAFIADALELDEEESVPEASTPLLVSELIGLAVDDECWTTRLSSDAEGKKKDRDFPTAFLVSVLRRYENFRDRTLCDRSRRWLATRVRNDGGFREQTTLLALTGLAGLLPRRVALHSRQAVEYVLPRTDQNYSQIESERNP
jgi:hypothetical protein